MDGDEHFEGFMEGIEVGARDSHLAELDATWRTRRVWALLTESQRAEVSRTSPNLASALDHLVEQFGPA